MTLEKSDYDAVICGAGITGIAAGVKLGEAGFNYLVVESLDGPGGVWRANCYPGARCDGPSVVYSFSFEPRVWTATHAPRAEILDYLNSTALKHGVTEQAEFKTTVTQAVWDDKAGFWRITVVTPDKTQKQISAKVLINAAGALSKPMKPKIPDLDLFKGLVMHTAEWTEGLNLKGKRVGIVGVGSSGTQLLSNICEEEGIDVTVFQRSCTTVLPFDFKVYSEAETADFKEHPEKLTEMREKEWASLESQNETAFIGHPGLDAVTQFAKDYMRSIVKDEQLQKKLEFDHLFLGKRPVLTTRYYEDLQRPNVHLVTEPIIRAHKTGLTVKEADGSTREIPLDILVFATGFSSVDYIPVFEIIGKNGVNLGKHFKEIGGAESLYGTTIEHMPNLFWMMGPSTYKPSNVFPMAEKQSDYIVSALRLLQSGKATSVTPKSAAVRKYNDEYLYDLCYVKKAAQAATTTNSWFRTGSKKKLTGAFPGTCAAQFAFLDGGIKEEEFDLA